MSSKTTKEETRRIDAVVSLSGGLTPEAARVSARQHSIFVYRPTRQVTAGMAQKDPKFLVETRLNLMKTIHTRTIL